MKDTYVIAYQEGQILSFLFGTDGRTKEIHADGLTAGERPGDLFAARVDKIIPGLNAAFICYAPGRMGYLQLDTCRDPFLIKKGSSGAMKAGDELIVQLVRQNTPPKRPTFTARYELTGSYAVVRPMAIKEQISVSRKLSPEERQHWRECAGAKLRPDRSILIRTNASAASEERVLNEIDILNGQLDRIHQKAMHTTVPCALYTADAGWLERLRGLSAEHVGKIVTDEKMIYDSAQEYLKEHLPELLPVLTLYQDPMLSMSKLYSLETRLEEALDRKVWLRSGGFLVIEQTEALVSIDVNTGKASLPQKKMSREEQFLKMNTEAALEIARQLRIRNLSGIIIADFINMEEKSSEEKVLDVLRAALSEDKQPCSVPEFTRLGLVEFTRKRSEKTLAQTIQKQ